MEIVQVYPPSSAGRAPPRKRTAASAASASSTSAAAISFPLCFFQNISDQLRFFLLFHRLYRPCRPRFAEKSRHFLQNGGPLFKQLFRFGTGLGAQRRPRFQTRGASGRTPALPCFRDDYTGFSGRLQAVCGNNESAKAPKPRASGRDAIVILRITYQ